MSERRTKESSEFSGDDIKREIASLDAMIPLPISFFDNWDFKSLWKQIKLIQSMFRDAWFDNPADRQKYYDKFQTLVERVKSEMSGRDSKRNKQKEKSEYIKRDILAHADGVLPDGPIFKATLAVLTLGASVLADKLTTRKEELQDASRRMKNAWDQYHNQKEDMIGPHRYEANARLQEVREDLQKLWDQWKEDNGHLARQRQAKHDAWKQKTAENIQKNRDRLDKLYSVIESKERNISNNRDRLSTANDSFGVKVEGWISEDEQAIAEIRMKIEDVKSYIHQDEEKLSNSW